MITHVAFNMSDGEETITVEELDKQVRMAMILEIDGLGIDGRALDASNERDKEILLNLSDDIKRQMLKFAEDRKNFLEL